MKQHMMDLPTTGTAMLKGQEKKLIGRRVKSPSGDVVLADHVMGVDSSTAAFLLSAADDTGKRFTIAFYGKKHGEEKVVEDVTEAGFKDIEDVKEYEFL